VPLNLKHTHTLTLTQSNHIFENAPIQDCECLSFGTTDCDTSSKTHLFRGRKSVLVVHLGIYIRKRTCSEVEMAFFSYNWATTKMSAFTVVIQKKKAHSLLKKEMGLGTTGRRQKNERIHCCHIYIYTYSVCVRSVCVCKFWWTNQIGEKKEYNSKY
jgi:hypothetical protein